MAGIADGLTPRPIRRGPLAGRGSIVGIAGLSVIATGASAVLLGLGTSQLNFPLVTTTPWVSAAGGDSVPAAPGGGTLPVVPGTQPGRPGVPGGGQTGVVIINPITGQPTVPGGGVGPPGGSVGRPPIAQVPVKEYPSGVWPSNPVFPPQPAPPSDHGFDIDLGFITIHIPLLYSAPADTRTTAASPQSRVASPSLVAPSADPSVDPAADPSIDPGLPAAGPLPYPIVFPSDACNHPAIPVLPKPDSPEPDPSGSPSARPGTGLDGLPTPGTPTADPTYAGRHRASTPGRHRTPTQPPLSYGRGQQPSGSWSTPGTPTTPTPPPSDPPASDPPPSSGTNPGDSTTPPAGNSSATDPSTPAPTPSATS